MSRHLVFISHHLRNQGFADSSVGKESTCNAGDPISIPGSGRFPGEGIGYPLQLFLDFPCGLASKEFTRNAGKLGLIPGLVRSPGEGKGYPLQYSGLENAMDSIVHGVAKSRTQLSNFHFHQIEYINYVQFLVYFNKAGGRGEKVKGRFKCFKKMQLIMPLI